MNKILLLGTVITAPVYFSTDQGQDLIRLTLETPSREDLPGETIHHHCLAWGPAALDLHEHLKHGDRIMVRGELQYRQRKGRGEEPINVPFIQIRSYSYLGSGPITTYQNK